MLYALAAFCVLGILTRLVTRHAYKRLLKESKDLSLTKNKSLKELRQRAENTYRINQGLVDSGAWLEHQLYEFHMMGIRLSGWSSMGPDGPGSACCLAERQHFFLTGTAWIPII